MIMLPLILGSSSKFRARVLRDNRYEFTVRVPNIDEKAVGQDDRSNGNPSSLVLQVASAKADRLYEEFQSDTSKSTPPSLLITSDQVVSYKGTVREKPESIEEARKYLTSYVDIPAETHTAIVVVNTGTGKRVSGVDVARQWFHPIPGDIVDELIRKGDVMYCCGGFMIDDPLLEPYLAKREGDEDSIIGMPLKLLERLLQEASL